MIKTEENSISAIAVTVALGATILLITLFYNLFISSEEQKPGKDNEKQSKNDQEDEIKEDLKITKNANNKKKKEKKVAPKKVVRTYEHPWAMSCLKGHSANITDMSFSSDGQYVVTSDDDRTILLWNTKDFNDKEHRSMRSNVEFDHLTRIAFSPDGKAIIGQLSTDNTIRVFKTQKRKDNNMIVFQGAFDYNKQSNQDVIDIGVSRTGKFVMACYSDTMVRLFDLKGTLLDTIDTHQMNNSHAQISSCGNLIATSGFTPDVIVWEIKFDKSGAYVGFSKAFDLCGHTAGIHHFDFSSQSKRMVTISKDSKWKCWDIDIEYKQRQDVVLLQTGQYVPSSGRNLCAISPDGLTVAISTNQSVHIYDVRTATCESVLEDVHTGGVIAMQFDFTSEILATAGDRLVQLTRNVVGLRATLHLLKQRLIKENLSSALKNRISEQISNIKNKLKSLNEAQTFSS